MPRKIFKISNMPVCAGGCLFVKKVRSIKFLLLARYKHQPGILEDFGGKVEDEDKDIYDTIVREVKEETNGLIVVPKNMLENCKVFPTTFSSKYFPTLICVSKDSFSKTDFGQVENHMETVRGKSFQLERTIAWYEYNKQTKDRLAYRLKENKEFISYLDSL